MGNYAIQPYARGEQGKTPFNGPGQYNGQAGFKFTSFRIDYPLAARIDQIAQSEGLTFTTVVTRMLEKGVKEFGKVKKGVEPRFGPSEHARDTYAKAEEKPAKKAKKGEEEKPAKKGKKAKEEAPAEKPAKKKAKKAKEEAPAEKPAKKKAKKGAEEKPAKKAKKAKKAKAAPPPEADEPAAGDEGDEPEIVDEE